LLKRQQSSDAKLVHTYINVNKRGCILPRLEHEMGWDDWPLHSPLPEAIHF